MGGTGIGASIGRLIGLTVGSKVGFIVSKASDGCTGVGGAFVGGNKSSRSIGWTQNKANVCQ
jgi:hypothetical protein